MARVMERVRERERGGFFSLHLSNGQNTPQWDEGKYKDLQELTAFLVTGNEHESDSR